MKKFFALCLSAALILTLLPSGARAVESFSTSEEGIAMVMEFEGYREMPYEDRGRWYVGYGTGCDPADFEKTENVPSLVHWSPYTCQPS